AKQAATKAEQKAGAAERKAAKQAATKAAAPKKTAPKKTAPKTTQKESEKKAPKKKAPKKAPQKKLAVKADERPWSKAELAEVETELKVDRERLRSELNLAEEELNALMRDAGDGAGQDQADIGSATFER